MALFKTPAHCTERSENPSADISKKRMKAERVYIGDQEYNLYPNRD